MSGLSQSQKTALKADIAANQNTVIYNGNPITISQLAATTSIDNATANDLIAQWYSAIASPDFFVLRSDVAIQEIYDQIIWANYTPSDAPDNTVTYQNRAMLCQTKQINLQLMLQGQSSFNAGRVNLRAGLNDATTALPSGASGAPRSGGWANILPILRRQARRVEKVFASQTSGVGITNTDALGATTNPGLLGYEGTVTYQDIEQARV